MNSILKLCSTSENEIPDFLKKFYSLNIAPDNTTYWGKKFLNPVEMCDLVAAFIDNNDLYPFTNLWISIDTGVFINIKDDNYDYFIQYMFERYPY
ncbi:MAG: hypothetical protein J6J36_04190 [Clostridia bacterium]|nr:hypothetical protein [Clostridia bacterium]